VHRFEKYNYTAPASCDFCNGLVWGPRTGVRYFDSLSIGLFYLFIFEKICTFIYPKYSQTSLSGKASVSGHKVVVSNPAMAVK
jgi:hypothetical protein